MEIKSDSILTPEEEYDIALRKIRFGHVIIFLMAGFAVITAAVHGYFFKLGKPYLVLYVILFFTYLALALSYYKNPFEISIAALCIYLFIFLFLCINQNVLLLWLAPLNAFIIIGLSAAIANAQKYNKAKQRRKKKNNNSDLLDDDFLSPDSWQ